MQLKDFIISEDETVYEAMELLDHLAKKIIFVAKDTRLVATVTDGDIRRWILKKGNVDEKIGNIANYRPYFLHENEKHKANQFMVEKQITAVPIVSKNMIITSIVFWDQFEVSNREKLDVPMVMMAGGKGTRLYPYTQILPKPLIPIGEWPIAEHIMKRFKDIGCENFTMIVNTKKEMIKAYFNERQNEYPVDFVEETTPLGTGGGLSLLKGKINQTFFLTNCDVLIDADYREIMAEHKKSGNIITMVCSMKRVIVPYGVVDIDEEGQIENMTEKPEFKFLTNTGMYVVEAEVVSELKENEVVDFTTIIERYKEAGERIGVYPISEYAWLDMGQLEELDNMRARLGYDG